MVRGSGLRRLAGTPRWQCRRQGYWKLQRARLRYERIGAFVQAVREEMDQLIKDLRRRWVW